MDEGILPHHEEYEEGIIGAVILEQRLYGEVSGSLTGGDFYSERHRMIWGAIGGMLEEGVPVDLVTLWERLKGAGELEDAGGSAYLTHLADNAAIEESLGYYAGIVRDDSRRRELCRRLAECYSAVRTGEDPGRIGEALAELTLTDSAGGVRRLRPVPAPEMKHIQPPPSLWADVIYPKCITQLNSEPGAGKSTFAYNICALGATGQPFLGIPFSKNLKSLYVDLETPDFLITHKIELICGGLPGGLHILDRIDLKRDFTELLALCREERYDLVVLDTQSRALAMEKENDNAEANYMAGLLKRVAKEAGSAILLIHHSTKSEEGKAVYRGRGASAMAGAVDVVVNVDVLTDDTLRMSVEKNRLQQSDTKLYIRKAGEDRFEPCESQGNGDESGFAIYRAQDVVVSLLSDAYGPFRAGEIVEAVQRVINVDRRTVERALNRLAQAGKVLKPKKGYYEFRQDGECDNTTDATRIYPRGSVALSDEVE
jgi:hypothetical protein